MIFGSIPLGEAEGALVAHAITVDGKRLRKGHRLTAAEIAFLMASGAETVVAAKLSPGDLDEDTAAAKIGDAMSFAGMEARAAATGRVNLHALEAGVFTVDKAMIDAVNAVDPAITIATLPQHATVRRGQMVATVKIIPFAVDSSIVDAATAELAKGEVFAVHAFLPVRVGLIQTVLPGVKGSVLDKTARVLDARLARSGSTVSREIRPTHDPAEVSAAIETLSDCDMIIIFGASAMSDFDDVVPAAIVDAGGEVLRAGMPVDPGNLLVLGRLEGKPVIGAPGCARSPKENGFDWVLDRLIAGLDVSGADIAGMGVGGLLMEIPTRPQPREAAPAPAVLPVEIIVLAAGRSSRMGGPNKLMARFSGKPLIRQTVERAVASMASRTIVVTGHQAERVTESLARLDAELVHNPDYANGLSSSIKAGMAIVRDEAAGVMIVLGDMPAIETADFDALITAFRESGGRKIVRAAHDGKRGNPVLLPRALFGEIGRMEGDTGARHLVEAGLLPVVNVEIGEAAFIDVDTEDAMRVAGGVLQD